MSRQDFKRTSYHEHVENKKKKNIRSSTVKLKIIHVLKKRLAVSKKKKQMQSAGACAVPVRTPMDTIHCIRNTINGRINRLSFLPCALWCIYEHSVDYT